MTERISLVEQYNNKDVIVQVKKCLDQTAEAVTVSTEARDTAAASATEAHTASQNANSASAQAQTAAQTVATYGTRLQNVEDQSAGNRSDIQTIDGEITDIYNDLTNVVRKVSESGQVIMNGLDLRGTNRTSDTVVGELNNLIVNAKRLIEEIDAKLNAYEFMIRTTGAQKKNGALTVANVDYSSCALYIENVGNSAHIDIKGTTTPDPDGLIHYGGYIQFSSRSGVQLCAIRPLINPNNTVTVQIGVRNSNGTIKWTNVANGDVI